ncbi:unnamed protein product [Protopolystoma xenopodis]|uniref:Uncharacterized protein n=1 Tax=Protopolystoma xenopodis TaxID=117903 RepID=A0A3S5C487_9PLAT|nr:unnamed protein product [Protopolystoma xenopodis]
MSMFHPLLTRVGRDSGLSTSLSSAYQLSDWSNHWPADRLAGWPIGRLAVEGLTDSASRSVQLCGRVGFLRWARMSIKAWFDDLVAVYRR